MKTSYPRSLATIRVWATQNQVSIREARVRFAQYVTLWGIANSDTLRELLVFKGGNALDFFWQPNRSTADLDFSADMLVLGSPFDAEGVRLILHDRLARALAVAGREFGVTYLVYKVAQQPPRPDSTFITYEARVTYALSDEPQLQIRITKGEIVARLLSIDISLNESICADEWVKLDDTEWRRLRVSTLEDIVAEKLRALLQQTIRNRTRSQDLLDITLILRKNPALDQALVAQYLGRKAAVRQVPVSRVGFRNPTLAARAKQDYAALEQTTRYAFIPFEQALAELLAFVETLDIPEQPIP